MIKFVKMSATGNDFIVIDNRKGIVRDRAAFACEYCHRHFGIGADGLILIEKASKKQVAGALRVDFRMRIFNPDGSEAEMCGNGARCAAVFAYVNGIVKRQMTFQTLAGDIQSSASKHNASVRMEGPHNVELNKKIMVERKTAKVHYIDMGVPHTVLIRRHIGNLDLAVLSPPIRFHPAFPRGTNVDYVQVVNRHRIKMRTYERGVEGETLACGTGALASAIVSALLGRTKPPVEVLAPGGLLKVYFRLSPVRNVGLEGEVRTVYEGRL